MNSLVLIVEDEPAIAENIKYALTTEGFTTEVHSSGISVLSFIKKNKVSLIILDIGLPDINGMELCKKIRKTDDIPIIFLTARSDEIDRVVGLEIGADDYMVKPFSPRELSARVKAVLRRFSPLPRNQNKTDPVLNNDPDFLTDNDRMKIFYSGEDLCLSRYEFRILSVMISNPSRIYSREKLLEMIWDEPEMSTDRTIDTHIKNIRAKLKKVNPENDSIQTHRGIGYSIKEEQ